MSITTSDQLEKLRACGRIVAKALRAMVAAVPPGMPIAELALVGSESPYRRRRTFFSADRLRVPRRPLHQSQR
jgi:methionine aminopeptidase